MKQPTFTPFLLFVFLLTGVCNFCPAQNNVGINSTGDPPDPSAALDIDYTDKGFLMPRLSTTQRQGIALPAVGLQIFNTTTNCIEIFIAGVWQPAFCGCTAAPAIPDAISAPGNICAGSTGNTFTIAAVAEASSYTWTVPSGASITSGQGTNGVSIDFGSTSGDVSVTANNLCGSSSASTLTITLEDVPEAPVPVVSNILTNQFTVSWDAVSGATNYEIDVSEDPGFSTLVIPTNAGNGTSIIVTGLEPNTTYYYRMRSTGICGASENSGTDDVTTDALSTLLNDLLAYWKLDGNGTNEVDGYLLTNVNSTPFNTGKIGTCADGGAFNSGKLLYTGHDFAINRTPHTFSFWVKINTAPTTDDQYTMLNNWSNTSPFLGESIRYGYSGGNYKIDFYRGGRNVYHDYFPVNHDLGTGTWHHIVITYSATQFTGYVDGSLITGPTTFNPGDGSTGVYAHVSGFNILGSINDDGENACCYTSGQMDEVGIWTRVLSPTEIAELYNSGTGSSYPF